MQCAGVCKRNSVIRSATMDEIEFNRMFKNLLVLIEQCRDPSAKNAMMVVSHLIAGLNERIDGLLIDDDE